MVPTRGGVSYSQRVRLIKIATAKYGVLCFETFVEVEMYVSLLHKALYGAYFAFVSLAGFDLSEAQHRLFEQRNLTKIQTDSRSSSPKYQTTTLCLLCLHAIILHRIIDELVDYTYACRATSTPYGPGSSTTSHRPLAENRQCFFLHF